MTWIQITIDPVMTCNIQQGTFGSPDFIYIWTKIDLYFEFWEIYLIKGYTGLHATLYVHYNKWFSYRTAWICIHEKKIFSFKKKESPIVRTFTAQGIKCMSDSRKKLISKPYPCILLSFKQPWYHYLDRS